MADLNAIANAIAEALRTISGLKVSAYEPDSIAVPAAWVGEFDSVRYDATFRGASDVVYLPVRVAVSKVTARDRNNHMYQYAAASGTKSIKAAIESDPTLDGTVQTVRVTEFRNIGTQEYAGADYWFGEFALEVYT